MSHDSIKDIIEKFEALMEDDELGEARQLIDEAIAAQPDAVMLLASKAELEIEEENFLEGVKILDEVLSKALPQSVQKNLESDEDEAAEESEEEEEVTEDAEVAEESEDAAEASEEAPADEEEVSEEPQVELDDEVLSHLLNLRGYATYYLAHLDESRRTFNQALRYDTENWSALVGRATTHDRMGFMVASLLDLEHAIEIDDQEAEPFALRGKIFLKRGEMEQASRDFAYALESDPSDEESRLHLARLLARGGATADAMELLGPLMEFGDNDDIVATGALLRSQLSMTLGSTDAAARDSQITIERWPEQPWGYLQLAACQLASMQGEETLKTLKTAEKFASNIKDIPDITALRASAYEQLGREDQARRERAKVEGTARLPAVVYGSILNPAQNVPINPDKPIDIRTILADLFGHPDRAPQGYEDALREVVDRIPSIIEENPNVEKIQIELPQVAGMRGGARNLVIQVNQQQRDAIAAANQNAKA